MNASHRIATGILLPSRGTSNGIRNTKSNSSASLKTTPPMPIDRVETNSVLERSTPSEESHRLKTAIANARSMSLSSSLFFFFFFSSGEMSHRTTPARFCFCFLFDEEKEKKMRDAAAPLLLADERITFWMG
jgi:hypothetical protein